ncbi:carboxylesterase family protein [Kribbella sandramycini]|uniref:Carboxylic ester hydrolase n=1 Tax=Kribbella sandramycini TaxID=60450 RepID=A0A7Y4NZR8_9ACTN|nr:carboxylesterase family protein [Kribbella sandramycini]MBB6569896.1 para-nitrobenzyl esterase [Kribbella sandramycini]NOL40279.1 carboxylesterase family protein [Kribbella sandramycini]
MVKVLALALAVLLPAPAALPTDPPIVGTDRGAVRGIDRGDHREFNGIPYAAPPRRWQSPQPAARWSDVRDATRSGPRCAQLASPTGTEQSTAEDCLYLNVTTPKRPGRKPVMVWLHGGGFVEGAGSEYDPRRLAVRGGVVVVTINYRLGIFGNFGYPGLEGSGTFGLEDQQAALRWVQRNATAFGGDPGNVTLFGQSAGGQSICAHLASPTAAGLFHRSIVQSSLCTTPIPANALAPGLPAVSPWEAPASLAARGRELAGAVRCSTLTCLAEKDPEELMPIFPAFAGLAYGTAILPENPLHSRLHDVPIMSGSTRDEMTYLLGLAGSPTPEKYEEYLDQAFGVHADRVRARYPLGNPGQTWAAITTDSAFACPTLHRNRAAARRAPTYAYEFADRTAPPTLPPIGFPYGAYHSADALYLFDLRVGGRELNAAQRRLANAMLDYWSAFAHTGDPNTPALPHWPRFHPKDRAVQSLDLQLGRTDLAGTHNCGLWATIPLD